MNEEIEQKQQSFVAWKINEEKRGRAELKKLGWSENRVKNREKIEKDVKEFLKKGGKIKKIKTGILTDRWHFKSSKKKGQTTYKRAKK